MFASPTPWGLSVFFAFSAVSRSFMRALGFSMGSHLCFALNSPAIHAAMTSSKSRPPSVRSQAVAFTTNLPMT